MVWCGLNLLGLGQRPEEGSCEHTNESSNSIRSGGKSHLTESC